jgi:hypothetical protein
MAGQVNEKMADTLARVGGIESLDLKFTPEGKDKLVVVSARAEVNLKEAATELANLAPTDGLKNIFTALAKGGVSGIGHHHGGRCWATWVTALQIDFDTSKGGVDALKKGLA